MADEKFRNSTLSPAERAEDLLGRLTLREKVGQVNQRLYGFRSYVRTGDTVELAEDFKREVERWGGLGVLYGLYRADPWADTWLNCVQCVLRKVAFASCELGYLADGIPMLKC